MYYIFAVKFYTFAQISVDLFFFYTVKKHKEQNLFYLAQKKYRLQNVSSTITVNKVPQHREVYFWVDI